MKVRKRHIVVDIMGNIMSVVIHAPIVHARNPGFGRLNRRSGITPNCAIFVRMRATVHIRTGSQKRLNLFVGILNAFIGAIWLIIHIRQESKKWVIPF